MYSVRFYGQMLADAPRMDAYAARCYTVTGFRGQDLGSVPGGLPARLQAWRTACSTLWNPMACQSGARIAAGKWIFVSD